MEKMKKNLFTILMVAVAVFSLSCLSSCGKEARMEKALEQVNEMLPMPIGNGLTMEKVVADGNAITYTVSCDESVLDMQMLEDNKKSLMEGGIQALRTEKAKNKDMQELFDYCIESNKNFVYSYVGKPSGKTVTVTINPKEI